MGKEDGQPWFKAASVSAATAVVTSVISMSILVRVLTSWGMQVTRVEVGNGAVEIAPTPDTRKIVYALSPAQVWANTQISVTAGQVLRFSVSGGVHIAAHQVTYSGLYDVRPKTPWLTRGGDLSQSVRGGNKNDALLFPEAAQGSVVAYICCNSQGACPRDTLPNTIREARKHAMVAVDADDLQKERAVEANCNGTLFLSINDAFPTRPRDYLRGSFGYKTDVEALRKRWKARVGASLSEFSEWGLEAMQLYDSLSKTHPDGLAELKKSCFFDSNAIAPDDKVPLQDLLHDWGTNEEERGYLIADDLAERIKEWNAILAHDYSKESGDDHLAELMCLSDAYRWSETVSSYPRIWFDDNAGLFLVTISIDKAGK